MSSYTTASARSPHFNDAKLEEIFVNDGIRRTMATAISANVGMLVSVARHSATSMADTTILTITATVTRISIGSGITTTLNSASRALSHGIARITDISCVIR